MTQAQQVVSINNWRTSSHSGGQGECVEVRVESERA